MPHVSPLTLSLSLSLLLNIVELLSKSVVEIRNELMEEEERQKQAGQTTVAPATELSESRTNRLLFSNSKSDKSRERGLPSF